ncbi:Putrescine--pyruvate aminotransferase [Roseovarius sp. EC-HK134]|jgi:putrescine aminotransferase|uniref:Beta-alanine--pyruvate aminotransferase n=1 Tax=Roseovarius mucosus TaxID=215743 RepID=A0A1V0RPI5_9RHOB|nr:MULTISPECIES: aspartate aminotransferase family protein [Roseovarius]MBS4009796.1 aspartate aminotransferase family protein [Roseovarius sp.]ARE83492.1 beta-alanine--pyruvate aminotransferase [Roseovarius mucosus]AWZ19879.1 Adenosylmethionine-8-amino-7-oxononanoate aminotransferase [Roseovarius sp. AK1035]EDM30358.1 putative aminotransferase [Roseovarius sp. TM1035]MBW4973040.1 aspartate aminotransferase family protein [Roseovarius mucosus]|tara:strand:+ start:7011 stop:8408 length:1398 start_codon:yes stop_codon:yes gene_type:complete
MTMITNHMPTAELQALDAAHHMHPFTHGNQLSAKGARIITRAKGVTLTDSEGHEILDGMGGLWCVNIGYGRKELADVAARQMMELPFYNTFFQTSHVPAIALSAKLAELAPEGFNHVFYAGSGSEANDTNLRMVRTYWAQLGEPERNVVISRKNAYHGSSVGSGSLGGMSGIHAQGGLPIPNIYHIDQPHWYAEGGDSDPEAFGLERARQLEAKIEELGAHRVAAFIAEPVQGAGGVIIPPDSYWPEIQRICDKYGILLIADEVICGFGRTGNWFGSQTYDIRPDIMTIAKGLSSGYAPIGGSLVSDRVAKVINACEFNHGYTYSGHPVSCAVALENLRILEEEKIIERVAHDTGPYLQEKWNSLAEHPMVGETRIIGMMGSLALTPHKASRAKFASEPGTAGYICRERCFANNLVMRHVGDRMIISPPLVISKSEIDTLIERAWISLDQAEKQIRDEGLMKAAA